MKFLRKSGYPLIITPILLIGALSCGWIRSNNSITPADPKEAERLLMEKKERGEAVKAATADLNSAFEELHQLHFLRSHELKKKLKDIFSKNLTAEKYTALQETKEYKDLVMAYKNFEASSDPTGLTISDVKGETANSVQKYYEEIIAFKQSPKGAEYANTKQRFDSAEKEFDNKLAEMAQGQPNERLILVLPNGHSVWISILSTSRDVVISSYDPDPMAHHHASKYRTVASFFDELPDAKKVLFIEARDLEEQKEVLEKEVIGLMQKFLNSQNFSFDTGYYRMPFDTSVDEDIKNRDALIQYAQEIDEAEAAFLALGKD